jgi:hypothetical protein
MKIWSAAFGSILSSQANQSWADWLTARSKRHNATAGGMNMVNHITKVKKSLHEMSLKA